MACKPYFTVPHTVVIPGDDVRLYRQLHPAFASLMGALYPKFASYTKAEKGYSAFAADGRFIGQFAGLTLQSIRRNPFLIDTTDLFMRALLAGLKADGYVHHSSVCDVANYGTLRLWQKMGLGATIDARGRARSAAGDPDTLKMLDTLMAVAKPEYPGVRKYAQRQLDNAGDPLMVIRQFIPTEAMFGGVPDVTATVTLDA